MALINGSNGNWNYGKRINPFLIEISVRSNKFQNTYEVSVTATVTRCHPVTRDNHTRL